MTLNSKWPSALRLVWITGGIVATNAPGPDVHIHAGANGRNICSFRISSYPSLFKTLQERGFPIIGVTFVVVPEELEGFRPPEFRAAGQNEGWPVWDARQKWRQIGFASSRSGHMALMDLASRIASGLGYSQMRLYDLAAAYSTQLRGYLHKSEAKDYQAFKDANSSAVYKAIHALFWEMAVLRDNLAEFVATFCLSRVNVASLSKLLDSLKKDPSNDQLANEIKQAADPKLLGWLATFTSYRNFFTHVAPMEQAAKVAFAIQDLRVLPSGVSIPQIYYALPKDIEGLIRKRSQGVFFSSLEELTAAAARRRERKYEPDALDYLHGCLNRLTELSLMLVARSPIAPEPIHINAEDIIGGVRVT